MSDDRKRDSAAKHPGKKSKKRKDGPFSGVVVGVFCTIAFIPLLAYGCYHLHMNLVVLPGLVNTHSELPRVTSDDAFSPTSDPELYWGTYAANLYFGLRTRSPKSPLFGVAWFQQPRQDIYLPKIRHWAEQSDGCHYGWYKHDGRYFGRQSLIDGVMSMDMSFVKRSAGSHGGDWSARVSVGPRDGVKEESVLTSVIAYFAISDVSDGSFLQQLVGKDGSNPNGFMLTGARGFTPELGVFSLKFRSKGNVIARSYAVLETPKDFAYIKETFLNNTVINNAVKLDQMAHYLSLPGGAPNQPVPKNPNLVAVQITVAGSGDIDVVFESGDAPERQDELSGKSYAELLASYTKEFDSRFESTFRLKEKGRYADPYIRMAQHALSNMVGSMSYFYGYNLVKSQYNRRPVEYGPHQLFTAMPCRPFFPRGFLWDEGFHHLLIRHWDSHLSEQSLSTWLDLMNVEGWIPRENILGSPAVLKVPPEFVVQQNDNANPPMFFFLLAKFAKTPLLMEKHAAFLRRAFPRLKLWYSWLNSSQAGPLPGSYRWRGRNATTLAELNPKTLTSGLDDYPRASHPSPNEYHLDLYCWMAIATKFMADLSGHFDEYQDKDYLDHTRFLMSPENLESLHYSEKTKRYCDYGLHTRNVKLERARMPQELAARGIEGPIQRVVKSEPKLRLVSDTFGYVSLFPLMMRMLAPSSQRLGHLLSDLTNPDLLWTDYGLRSLAKLSPLYEQRNTEHDPPYWRGSIWLNMNYLVLDALHHYAHVDGPHKNKAHEVYNKLRANIISNVLTQYGDTGFLWEHYNDRTGEGEGAHPFTGWTSLIVLIMAEKYD